MVNQYKKNRDHVTTWLFGGKHIPVQRPWGVNMSDIFKKELGDQHT